MDKDWTPNPSRLGEWLSRKDKDGTLPNPCTFGVRLPKRTRIGPPPTLHDLEWLQKDKDWHPPTLHDLEWRPKRTRIGPPQPFTTWSGSAQDKDWTPQPFTIWAAVLSKTDKDGPTSATLHDLDLSGSPFLAPKWTRIGPPNPSRFGAPPQKDKDWTPQPFTTWRSGHLHGKDWTPQPFTTWSGSPKGQGVAHPNRTRIGNPPNPSRFGAALPKGQGLDPPTLHDLAAIPFQHADS